MLNTRIQLLEVWKHRNVDLHCIAIPKYQQIAINVPIEMTSARASKVVKNAIIDVNIPVITVTTTGILIWLSIFQKNGNKRP